MSAEGSVDRREAIKRAAVAAAGAGVVWSAPKIEGLSLAPSLAGAGGSGATVSVTRGVTDCPGDFGQVADADTFGACNSSDNPVPATVTSPSFGPSSTPCVSKITFNGKADTDGAGTIAAVTDGVSSANCVISAIGFAPGDYADAISGIGSNTVNYSADNNTAQANSVVVTITC